MRNKSLAAIVAIALTVAIGFSVIGQEEPLPVVTPKYRAPEVAIVDPVIVLASEPLRDYRPPTLLDAARNNDYVTFDALYSAAKKRGEDVAAWDTLHELWTYAITDPIGAFYGVELYERLSRAYPGFAAYIEPYRIVDSKGQVFYPTSETRAFLLARAAEGRPAPKVLVAEAPKPEPKREPAPAKQVEDRRSRLSGQAEAPVVRTNPAPAPVAVVEQPVVITASEPAPQPAALVTQAQAEATAQAQTPAPAPAQTIKPTTTTATPAASTPATAPATTPAPAATRGILLMIIGLIAIGLLAVILRTPKEEPMMIRPKPDNVEPLRKPQAAAAAQPPSSDSRAAG